MPTPISSDLLLAEDMARLFYDPLGFVLYAFDWDDPELQLVELQEPWRSKYNRRYGPDVWACEILDEVGRAVRDNAFDGAAPVPPLYCAVASGHGIGKSALTAWLILWIMSTRPFCRGTVTAVTNPQLSSKTWPELAKWHKRCITGHWFEVTSSPQLMRIAHRQYPRTWLCTAQTCKEENAEAFAGQHAADSTSFYIFDEASGVPDKIFEVARGGLTDGEPMLFAFGNPTRNTGWFAKIFRERPDGWILRQIDSRKVAITNKAYLDSLVREYGEDSDFVKVRVRGMFPSVSSRQCIPVELVEAAARRHLNATQYDFAPVVITVDPAWEGDDELVIAVRQGLYFNILRAIPKNQNDIAIARLVMQYEDELNAAAVFIDGGFGTGIVSVGREAGRKWRLIWFSAASPDAAFLNLRAYMWDQMRQWLEAGGAIPNDPKLIEELTAPELIIGHDGKVKLEPKAAIKEKIGRSPDRADALALSFAAPLVARPPKNVPEHDISKYDPYARLP